MNIFGIYIESYVLYIILVLPCVIWAFTAQVRVSSVFGKYSRVASRRGYTGADMAENILRANGCQNVGIAKCGGNLTDHYDPRTNTVYLSESVYGSASVAACGVAAHECGHAIQYAQGYVPVKIRTAMIPVTNIGSNLAMPLIIIGIIFSFEPLAYAGIICFAAATVFQLVTLPVEFNASRRALACMESGCLVDSDEIDGARKVLRAAAMTYVAALAVSLANLLRLLVIVMGNGRRRR